MPFRSLRAFVDALRKAGELHVVSASVDPRLEISEITNRVVKAGGPALLFTDVKGSEFPVLTNQFGTHRRMAMALGAESLDDVAARVRALLDFKPPSGSCVEKLTGALHFAPLANAIPKIVRDGSVQTSYRAARSHEVAGLDDLAARCRAVHHVAAGNHERSAQRPHERRHVSHAGL